MPLDTVQRRVTPTRVIPVYSPEEALELTINLPPSSTIARGTVLGEIGASAVNAVQTWTISGSPGSGNFKAVLALDGNTYTTGNIAYNAASTGANSVQAALDAILGTGNSTAAGSAGGPYTITFVGKYAGRPIPSTTFTNTFNTGSIASADTTAGQTAGAYNTYSSAVLAAPTTAPTLAAAGSDGTFAVGSYEVTYTLVTAAGETTESPAASIAVASTNHIAVSSITGLDAAVTKVRAYVDGVLAKEQTVTAGATGAFNILAPSTTLAATPPQTNTAYTASGNAATAKCILEYDCVVDANGKIRYGISSSYNDWSVPLDSTPAWFSGVFRQADLVGLDTKALTDLNGRVLSGSIAAGNAIVLIAGI